MSKRKTQEQGCCGTCHHNRYDVDTKTWVCKNRESDNFALETTYRDSCIDYEERWQ